MRRPSKGFRVTALSAFILVPFVVSGCSTHPDSISDPSVTPPSDVVLETVRKVLDWSGLQQGDQVCVVIRIPTLPDGLRRENRTALSGETGLRVTGRCERLGNRISVFDAVLLAPNYWRIQFDYLRGGGGSRCWTTATLTGEKWIIGEIQCPTFIN